MPAIPVSERPEQPSAPSPPRALTEEERRKLVDDAADAFMTEHAAILRDLAK